MEIEALAGQPVRVNQPFKPPGSLTIQAKPGGLPGAVELDGQAIGDGRKVELGFLAPGPHQLAIQPLQAVEGARVVTMTVSVVAGQATIVTYDLGERGGADRPATWRQRGGGRPGRDGILTPTPARSFGRAFGPAVCGRISPVKALCPWPRARGARVISLFLRVMISVTVAMVPAVAHAQSDGPALERRAIAAYEEGDVEGAIALYRSAIQRFEPAGEKIRIALIVALLEHDLGRDNAAIKTLAAALALDTGYRLPAERYDEDFQRLFRTARDRAIIQQQNRAVEHVQRATEDIRAGRDELARDALERALELNPGLPSAIYNLAYLDLRVGRENEALAGFERLIAQGRRPDGEGVPPSMRAQALTNLGYLYARRQQHAEAAAALEEAVAITPEHAGAWLNLGQARRALGEPAAARTAFERAYALAPDDAAIVRYEAEARVESGASASAVGMLEQALARTPTDAGLWYTLARAQAALGQDAGPSFASALQADADDRQGFGALAAFQLARRACDRQDAERCASYADRALQLRASWIDALLVAAQGRRALGDLAGAQDALERAVRLDPTRAEVHNNLGDIYCRSRDPQRAERAFLRALEIRSDFAAARDNLAAVRAGGCRG